MTRIPWYGNSMRVRLTLSLCLVACLVSAYGYQRSESSRISIKHGTDAAAAKIPSRAKATTVEEMLNQTRPDGLAPDLKTPEYQEKRIEKFETTKWTVEVLITEIIKRADGDFYMVIEGATGAKTVVEAPDPELCEGSHFLKDIKRVRKILDDKFHPTGQPLKVHIKAKLTGVGFFGYQGRGGTGPVSNGARLMPALDVKILN